MARTPEYKAWQAMIDRCDNKNNQRYERYGGRGIRVCDRWSSSFAAFFEDLGPRPSKDHSLDRIDNDGDYEPGNCRWATRETQIRNTSRNIYVDHDGKRMTLADWSRETGINFFTLRGRILKGWSTKDALETPPGGRRPSDAADQETN